jgi:threonyl-tRNA synthetase
MPIDHRNIGKDLELFALDDQLGHGLPMWLPAGAAIRHELERFVVDLERGAGYRHVCTPPLAKRSLYERSGHWAHYRDAMFPPMTLDEHALVLRPMNCPHHMRVFAHCERSYRDLPLRVAELGAMFRYERSGVVSGLSRVRAMTLNDGHVFCRDDQVDAELVSVLHLVLHAHDVLGVEPHRWRLSLRGGGEKFVDGDELWDRSASALRGALGALGIAYEEEHGEAAFYGPKIDVQVLDANGREETLSTVQVDFALPARLGLSYVGADGGRRAPVAIHRSLVSTMERMVAHLLERYEGALPAWLAPVQVAVLPVSDAPALRSAADRVVGACLQARLRAELLDARASLASRVRHASLAKVPYVAVVGDREAAHGTVSVRARGAREQVVPAFAFVDDVQAAVAARSRG